MHTEAGPCEAVSSCQLAGALLCVCSPSFAAMAGIRSLNCRARRIRHGACLYDCGFHPAFGVSLAPEMTSVRTV